MKAGDMPLDEATPARLDGTRREPRVRDSFRHIAELQACAASSNVQG
jgi:hypothetical protein